MKTPCHECAEREPECHATCEKYKRYAIWCEMIRKRRADEHKRIAQAMAGVSKAVKKKRSEKRK